ncbi:MAG TPA: Fe-S cluster assembly protein HesB [Thermoanaerobaculia bacterium]
MTRIDLPLPRGFSFDAVVRSHGWYNLAPFSYDKEKARLDTVVEDRGRAVDVRFDGSGGGLAVEGPLAPGALRRLAGRVFSLELDLAAVRRDLAGDPRFARALDRGAGRILRAPTAFEDAVKMLFTTNCSWAATQGMVVRLIALAGADGRAFPTAGRLARRRAATLRSRVRCGYRAEPLAALARRVASGRLDLAAWEEPARSSDALREAILLERGFGPYAAEGLMRILGRHDYLSLDTWVRWKYRQLYPGPRKSTDRAIARRYAKFGASKGLALWLEMTEDWHTPKD